MSKRIYFRVLIIAFFFVSFSPVFPVGTYSEGWTIAKLIQFESRGIVFESYEGIMEVTVYEPAENCDQTRDECFTPMRKKVNFSVRPEHTDLVNFLSKQLNQTMLFQFNVHRIQAVALSSNIEVIHAQFQENILPHTNSLLDPKQKITVWIQAHDTPQPMEKFVSRKTGGKRNFSVGGRILSLEYKGTIIGTYEGLYWDESRGKVHPFSITDEEMAEFAWKSMKYNGKYYLGISVAFVTGVRQSDYDLFEINFREPAGGLEKQKPK